MNQSETMITVMSGSFYCEGFLLVHVIITMIIKGLPFRKVSITFYFVYVLHGHILIWNHLGSHILPRSNGYWEPKGKERNTYNFVSFSGTWWCLAFLLLMWSSYSIFDLENTNNVILNMSHQVSDLRTVQQAGLFFVEISFPW